MKNSKGVSLIALIITIIVIIILAAIVMNASTDTVGNAQYARFAQEFGEYSDQVALDAANIKSNTGIKGQIINNAQMFYMVANGLSDPTASGEGVAGYTMPVGYFLTNNNSTDHGTYPYVLQNILTIGNVSGDGSKHTASAAGSPVGGSEAAEVAYVIDDGEITNYKRYGQNPSNGEASHEFYGDSNGKEYHFVTSNGAVFTLPGFPVQQADGSIEYHIDSKNGHFYVVAGNSGKTPNPSNKATNVNGSVITNTMPITAADIAKNLYGINAVTGQAEKGETIKQGTGAVKIGK